VISPRILLVTDPAFGDERIVGVVERAGAALPAGAFCVQLRDKARGRTSLRLFASRLRLVTRRAGASLVVNGDAEVARDVGADGVHWPDGAPHALPASSQQMWVSVAAHSDETVVRAVRDRVDAALVSPIFSKRARGLAALRAAHFLAARALKIYALGGVTPDNAGACASAGADGVAVIRALLAAADPASAARRLHDALVLRCYSGGAMASYEESLQVTCDLLRRHVDQTREIRPTDHIQNDLGLDSLSLMELVNDVEKRFGVSVPTEMFDRIATVDDVARVVEKLVGRGSA
jgi:thiamine-phosphate pyrophosphorylase